MSTYYIHSNGGRPFKVEINENTLYLYKMEDYETSTYQLNPSLTLSLVGRKVFYPKGNRLTPSRYIQPTASEAKGNSLLVELAPFVYLYIGSMVYIFNTDDHIIAYYSPIGNSDVPYPWAVGTENVYLMIEQAYMNIGDVTNAGMPYEDYYGSIANRRNMPEPKFRVRTVLDSNNEDMAPSTTPRCYRYTDSNQCLHYYPNELPAQFLEYLN